MRQLAEVIGVSGRQVERLTIDGVFKVVRCKLRGRRYRLRDSVQAYLRYSRESVERECSRGGAAYDVARAQRMKALAEIETLRLKQVRGEVISRKSVTTTVVALIVITKNHVLSIPSRCSRQLVGVTDQARVYDVLDTECRGALRELSEFSVEDYIALVTKTAAAEPQPRANGESESD